MVTWYSPASPLICFLDLRRASTIKSGDDLSLDSLEFVFLALTDSPFEIEDWIRRNRAIICSWSDALDFLPLDDVCGVSFSSSFILLKAELLRGGLPPRLLFPSDLKHEALSKGKSFWKWKSEGPSAISAKFNKLHQKMISQSVIHKTLGPNKHKKPKKKMMISKPQWWLVRRKW